MSISASSTRSRATTSCSPPASCRSSSRHEIRHDGDAAMKLWHFSEGAYPFLPEEHDYGSIRVTLPNRIYDPKIGAELYHRFLDEWLYADEEGLDIQINEHHQTPTCVDPAAPILLGILARQTRRARLLILGNPIGNRNQPVRVAEEMAMVDVISKGRVEC